MQEIHNPKRESSRSHGGLKEFVVEVHGTGFVRVLASDAAEARAQAARASVYDLELDIEVGRAEEVPEFSPGTHISGRPLIKLREEQGLDSQACAFARAKFSIRRRENMSTRAMVCVNRYGGSYEMYYRHCDGYPTALGAEIVRALLAGKSIDEVIEAIGATDERCSVDNPEDAFLKRQSDLEWVYALRQSSGTIALQVLKTSDPHCNRSFVWPVWGKYSNYMKRSDVRAMETVEQGAESTLHALAAFEKAQPLPGQPGGPPAPAEICNECGRPVTPGSGRFVNRVPDCNTPEERKAAGKPFPQGDFLCAECDAKEVGA